MQIVRSVAALRRIVRDWRAAGEGIGVVPTMGALHAGHLALVQASQARGLRTIVTLFVNPKQFERPDDLAAYPRTEASDAEKLRALSVEVLFAPPAQEMYPEGFVTTVSLQGVADELEGESRPGHFAGMATVVSKLLLQSQADFAFFGEKDWQQLQVVKRMVADLDIPIEIVGVDTVREPDGLALSSRNVRLTPEQRRIAPGLHRALTGVAARFAAGTPTAQAEAEGREALGRAGFDRVDYIAVRNGEDLKPADDPDRARVLAAAWLGPVRLIDNVPVRR